MIPSNILPLPNLSVFLNLILRSSLFHDSPDLVFIYDGLTIDSTWYNHLLKHCEPVRSAQQWNLREFRASVDLRSCPIHLRGASTRPPPLLISVCVDAQQLQASLDWQRQYVVEYFTHTQVLIVPEPSPEELSRLQELVGDFLPPTAAILVIAYDDDGADVRVRRISSDLHRWHNAAEFLMQMPAIDSLNSTFQQRQHRIRNGHFPIQAFDFWSVNPSARAVQPYIRLLQQYFRVPGDAKPSVGPRLSAFIYPQALRDEGSCNLLIVPRFARQQYAMIVPNWWQMEDDGNRRARSPRLHRTATVFHAVALLVGALLLVTCSVSPPHPRGDRGRLVLDMWARVLGMAGPVPDHEHSSSQRGIGPLRLSGSLFGLANGMLLTSLLLDVTLRGVWSPVFQSNDDLWSRSGLPIVYDQPFLDGTFYLTLSTRVTVPLIGNRMRLDSIPEWLDNRRSCAMLVDDDYTAWTEHRHSSNGSAVYRKIRDPKFAQEHSLAMEPCFLGPRLQQLSRRMSESGLQQRIDANVDDRHEQTANALDHLDEQGRLRMAEAYQCASSIVLYLTLYALSACVWLAECVLGRRAK